MRKILVVGAGFSGAVYARELAENGFVVDVIDKRSHIAGNCYDYVHECGVRVHRYGPHLFHTSNQTVVDWLSQFTAWIPYEHRVVARLEDGRQVPLPVNIETVNAVFGTQLTTAGEVGELLSSKATKPSSILNAEDQLYSTIGPELTNLFFRPYTLKMWGRDLRDTDAAVVRRLQIRSDLENRYFPNDTFQAMPMDGYTRLFERILDHEHISVTLNRSFAKEMLNNYDHCFNSMPIDEFYEYDLGELPYRSIRFHLTQHPRSSGDQQATINYTDSGPYTRETWWHNIGGQQVYRSETVLRTVEEPCDYKDNGHDRYYPVKSSDGKNDELYRRYAGRSDGSVPVSFIGRCGTYQYLDMHQVINQSLSGVRKWLNQTV